MPLDAVVEDINNVDESMRDHYQQAEDGKYVLSVNPANGFALENVEGLKSALSKERERAKIADKYKNALGDVDPSEAAQALEKLKEYENFDPNSEADKIAEQKFQSWQEQVKSKNQQEIEARDNKLNEVTGQLEKVMIDNAAMKAITDHKGSTDLLLPHVKAHTRLSQDNEGGFKVEVVDQSGQPRIGDSQGNPMTISQLVKEMKNSDTFAPAFEGTSKSGGGTPSSKGTGGPSKKSRSQMSTQEKTEFIKEHGYTAYTELPD